MADPYLECLAGDLFIAKMSISQRFGNSLVWRAELKSYTEDLETRIGKAHNVNAAKPDRLPVVLWQTSP